MVEVKVHENESIDSAVRRFRKKCEREGIFSDIRRNQYHDKPSVRKKKKALAAKKRRARRRGFTLLELLIVLAMIGAMFLIMVNLGRDSLERSKEKMEQRIIEKTKQGGDP